MDADKRRAEEIAGRLVLGRVLGGLLHEFNNSLGIVSGYAELLAEEASDEDSRDMAERIRAGAERMQELVRFLQPALRRPSSQERGPVDLPRLVEQAVALCQKSFQSTEVPLEVEIRGDLPLAETETTTFLRVLMTLLEALRSGRVRAGEPGTLRVELGFHEGKPEVRLLGGLPGGLDDEWLPALPLDPVAPSEDGARIVALCHALLSAHGGQVSLETVDGAPVIRIQP